MIDVHVHNLEIRRHYYTNKKIINNFKTFGFSG